MTQLTIPSTESLKAFFTVLQLNHRKNNSFVQIETIQKTISDVSGILPIVNSGSTEKWPL